MEITGSQLIDATRTAVWDALNDPATLKRCLPGCESVERTSAEEYRIILTASVGPLRARFNGVLRMTEADPPKSCVMVFEGQGGGIGFGKGSSTVTLNESGAGTELQYTAHAQVGGKLAQVGSRMIDSVAKKMSDDFFKAFRAQFAPPETLHEAVAATPASAPDVAASDAKAAASAPRPSRATPNTTGASVVLVPGWWLAVAVALGAAAAVAGMQFVH
jgi:uncharacterized protein